MPPLSYNPDAPDVLLYEHYQKIRRQFIERHDKAVSDVGALYHYTTAEGLQSILSGRSFWASHIAYLNDSSELEYGLTLVRERLKLLAEAYKSEYVKQFVELLDETISHPLYKEFFDAHVVCFCTNGDLLSQWRGYGSGGGGYAIGLATGEAPDKQPTGTTILGQEGRLHLRQVIYDREEQTELIDPMLSGVANIVERFGPVMEDRGKFSEEVLKGGVSRVTTMLAILLPCFKNSVFSEEQEWRYIYFTDFRPDGEVKYRIRNGNFVPYVPLDIFRQAQGVMHVSDIYCGPTKNADQSIMVLSRLILSLGYERVLIRPSEIPLRF